MTSCPRCGRYTTAPTHCGADVGQAAVCACGDRAMAHGYRAASGRNDGACLVCGCVEFREGESGGIRTSVREKSAATWENKGGPEGALTPVVPALDQHTCVRGSASRG